MTGFRVWGLGDYTGALRYDLPHGKGIVTEPQKKRIVAIWDNGKVLEELISVITSARNSGVKVDRRPRGSGRNTYYCGIYEFTNKS